jgi:hypothetical protein
MPLINTADALFLGDLAVARAYQGDVLVWPTAGSSTLTVTLAKVSGQAKVTISTAYNGATPDIYRFYLSENGGAWTFKYEGGAGPHTFNVGYSKNYQAKVESFKSGLLLNTAYSNTVTTDAAPPPPTVQKIWEGTQVEYAVFKGNGGIRAYDSGPGYSGYFSSTYGNQKTNFRFNIPGDVRWCKSVDKVEFSAWNDHAYWQDGSDYPGRYVSLALHHYSDLDYTKGVRYGSTGTFKQYKAPYRDSWVGNVEWVDITHQVCPDRYAVWDEFRRHGAQGITMNWAPNNNQGYYGYVRNDVRLRITYTVET